MPEPNHSEQVRVLIVEDDPVDAELIVRELRRGGFAPEWLRVEREEEYLTALETRPDVILSDSSLPLFDGFEALDLLRKRDLDIPFILVSGRLGEDVAVDAMKRGACDYLLKDRLARLGDAVRRAIDDKRLRAERTWAVGALRQSEERYRLVSETSSDYVYSLVPDADAAQMNSAPVCEWITDPFQRITGFNRDDINRSGWRTLYHPYDSATVAQHDRQVRRGASSSMDVRIVCRNKEVRWMRVSERPVSTASGTLAQIYGAAQDITVQKHLEEELVQSRKMEAIGQLAGGVAHDFNNLLTVICGYGDLLKRLPELSVGAREYTDEILEAARRAAQLTRQLLAFGRRQVLQPRIVSLNTVVGDLDKLLRRLIGEDIELRASYAASPAFVKVDPGQIEQVMMNLAVNARDAMPKGGRLTIETANVDFDRAVAGEMPAPGGGSHVMLTVSDTGTGMDEATAARIFEPFFTTKDVGKGTGLGLAMAYGIVTQSGGEIRVRTEAARGTAFKIYLPRMEGEYHSEEEAAPFTLTTSEGTETILVLEDEDSLRSLMRQVLTREGHRVLDTGDSDDAIGLCREHPGEIALLITDMVLPKLSGPQVAERVLQMRPGIRIIYTSGYPGKLQIPGNQRTCGTAFFEKPFTAETLISKVRSVLDEGKL